MNVVGPSSATIEFMQPPAERPLRLREEPPLIAPAASVQWNPNAQFRSPSPPTRFLNAARFGVSIDA
jgi:hypothetical protein